jgi:hypothetical protein
MANFLSNFFDTDADTLIEAIGGAIDKHVVPKEEANELENELAKASVQYSVEMASLGLQEKKSITVDTASAREHQIRILEIENASWLTKNVHSVLAVGIIGLTFTIYFMIIKGDLKSISDTGVKDIIIYILGALTTISTQVAAYFFGSSHGSKEKQKSLDNLTTKVVKTV